VGSHIAEGIMRAITLHVGLISLVGLAAMGCDQGTAPAPDTASTAKATAKATATASAKSTATATAAASATAAAAASGSAAVAAPAPAGELKYPLTAIKPLADSCGKCSVILGTAPVNKDNLYGWVFVSQAMAAHPQFKLMFPGEPTAPMEIQFQMFDAGDGKAPAKAMAVVAFAADGSTCNKLAAMYKGVVRSSNPQLFCGEPKGVSNGKKIDLAGWRALLIDPMSKCTRLASCLIAVDPATPGDPGLECQQAPQKFKTDCAMKDSCAEVAACANK
jgi:hypothetical protein